MVVIARLGSVVLLLLALAGSAAAQPPAASCDPAAAAAARAIVDRDIGRARTWNIAWAIVYGAAAGLQFGMVAAEWTPLGEYDAEARAGALVGGVKASIGLASKFVLPLRLVPAPAPTGDACADLAAA